MRTSQKIKIIFVGAVTAGVAALGLVLTASAHAQSQSEPRYGICQVGVDSPCNGSAQSNPY